jgi:hypothetical protein
LSRRPDGCIGTLETSRTLKRVRTCCHDVRTNATLKLLDTDGGLDGIATSSRRMLLTDEGSDVLLGRPNGNKGSDISEFESAQNLPGIPK